MDLLTQPVRSPFDAISAAAPSLFPVPYCRASLAFLGALALLNRVFTVLASIRLYRQFGPGYEGLRIYLQERDNMLMEADCAKFDELALDTALDRNRVRQASKAATENPVLGLDATAEDVGGDAVLQTSPVGQRGGRVTGLELTPSGTQWQQGRGRGRGAGDGQNGTIGSVSGERSPVTSPLPAAVEVADVTEQRRGHGRDFMMDEDLRRASQAEDMLSQSYKAEVPDWL